MKVIDLFNEVKNGNISENVVFEMFGEKFEGIDELGGFKKLSKELLLSEVEIIEDTPEENKKINNLQKRIDKAIRYIEPKMICEYIHTDYINNMIKILKGE